MLRFFVSPDRLQSDEINLPEEVFHHLRVVLRRSQGEEILLLDGLGGVCRCRVDVLGKKGGTAKILERWQEVETAFPVYLLQGLPKGDKLDLVLQKGTELGIGAFTPVISARSVPVRDAEREDRRVQRWQKIIQEAARQCRRSHLPRLHAAQSLEDTLASCRADLKLMLWEEESRPLNEVLSGQSPRDVAVLVGPEGGFTADEAASARRFGFVPVRCGPRILRSETAGFAVTAVLQYLYGDLGRGGDL